MTREEAIDLVIKVFDTLEGECNIEYDWSKEHNARDMAIKALEQEPCKDAKYEEDLNELKEQILKDGDTSVSKRDLLERFCEIDKEYKGRPWNLLQILANINILIGTGNEA